MKVEITMEKEMLQLEQYINIHPIRTQDEKYRIAYVSLIKYICEKYSKNDKWCDSMITLMKQVMIGEKNYFSVHIKDNNRIIFGEKKGWLFRYKFQKQSYIILTDCLFATAFNNKMEGEEILENICKLFPKKEKKLRLLFELFYKVDISQIKKDFTVLLEVYKILENNRAYLMRPQKRIIVTANMSAGKSTLLNALTGKKINKTQNDTCTAKIHYLYNKAGEDGLSYELDHKLILNATRKELMEDNEDNSSSAIAVGTRFRSLGEINRRVCFIDTPGVNSSQNKEHREMTNNAIADEDCDLLLYLLNGENIGTDDDVKHLQYVHERYHGDILFIVNKLDRFKKGIDSVPKTLADLERDLKNIGYEKPKIYPISAYAAYLAKMSMYGEELSEDEIDDLELSKRKLSKEEFQFYKYYGMEKPVINEQNEMESLLCNSGILSLEKLLY